MTEKSCIELLEGTGASALGAADVVVSGIAYRSNHVLPGDLFVCVRGFVHDGHEYAKDAVARGAAALVVEHELSGVAVPQFLVTDSRATLAVVSARFEGEPSRFLDVIGITGTNGKTTTVYLVDSILRAAGRTTGLIGTVETRIAGEPQPSSRTTPESSDLQVLLSQMRDAGVSGVSMEVSSHAIDLHRVDAVHFAVVAFTNLTQDHLDYHHTIEEYASVKRRLFTDFDSGARVIDIDDPYGRLLAVELADALTVGRASRSLRPRARAASNSRWRARTT